MKNNKLGILHIAGIGDWLLQSIVLNEFKKRYLNTKIYVVAPKNIEQLLKVSSFIDGYNLLPSYSVFTDNFSLNDKIFVSSYFGFRILTKCKANILDLVSRIFALGSFSLEYKFFLPAKYNSFGKYYSTLFKNKIITVCNSTTEKEKCWDTKRWETIVNRFPEYIFVQIGDYGVPIKGAVSMLGKTSLFEACSLVKFSKAYIGIDGLFNHVSHFSQVPSLILWGPLSPDVFGYLNNSINIFKRIQCSPCEYIFNKKCRQSYYLKNITPCMAAIGINEVVLSLKNLLSNGIKNVDNENFCRTKKDACSHCKHQILCSYKFFEIEFSKLFLLKLLK